MCIRDRCKPPIFRRTPLGRSICDLMLAVSRRYGRADYLPVKMCIRDRENTEGLDLVNSATRLDLLENKVTLAVPEGNPKGIESFDQLAGLLASGDVFLAMGNSDVPVGQYPQKIFTYYGLNEETLASSRCV